MPVSPFARYRLELQVTDLWTGKVAAYEPLADFVDGNNAVASLMEAGERVYNGDRWLDSTVEEREPCLCGEPDEDHPEDEWP